MFARPSADMTVINQTDAFLKINNVTFRTDRDAGGLAQAGIRQLYEMSVRNGLNMTFRDFSVNRGSIVCADIQQGDVGGYIAGSKETFSFDVSVTFTNTTADVIDYPTLAGSASQTAWKFYVMCLMDG